MLFATRRFMVFVVKMVPILSLSSGIVQDCFTPKEGAPHTFHAIFKRRSDKPLEILWTRNGRGMSMCTQVDGCMEYWEDETITSMELIDVETCQSNLTIRNFTDKECGQWDLQFLGPAAMEHPESMYTCSLNVEHVSNLRSSFIKQMSEVLTQKDILLIVTGGLVIITVLTVLLCIKRDAVSEKIKKGMSILNEYKKEKSPKVQEVKYAAV